MMTLLNKLDKKQKILLAVLGVVLLVLVWQLYQMFSNKPAAVPPMPAMQKTNSAIPVNAGQVATPANVSAPGATAAVDPATNSQAEYLRLVNEYQMAQLQRMIAEDNEAIAVARRNAAQAMSDTTKMVGGSAMISANNDNNDQGSPNTYSLVYTGQQDDGQWTATLKKNGQSYDVVPGRNLSDGSQVLSIDENGVLLAQNHGATKVLVTFSGETQINNQASNSAAAPVALPVAPVVPAKNKTIEPAVKASEKTPAAKPVQTKPVLAVTNNKKADSQNEARGGEAVATNKVVAPAKSVQTVTVVTSSPLEKIDPKLYTIQLTADKTQTDVTDFIKAHGLQGKANFFQGKNKHGEDWFIAVYGQYPTRQAAQAALKELPATMREEGAYIISYGDLQKTLDHSVTQANK